MWRRRTGIALVALGCLCPLAIPLLLALDLSAGTKAALVAALAFGLPEVLILAAIPVMGREEVRQLLADIRAAAVARLPFFRKKNTMGE